ncbi:MAG: hypothetical protein OHK0023_25020 [Anaerolineae bacterium]
MRRIILIVYLLLAIGYSLITPVFEASDELWHYPMVQYIATNGFGLPVQKAGIETAWRQEGSQPPLYYQIAALLTFWIDTSNLAEVRQINPHADIGVVVPDRNANMTIHDPSARSFPWRGAMLAAQISRFLSVLLGAITVWYTYALAELLFPQRKTIASAAMALVAFNPMFLFISGSVNNDNLSTMLATVLLVLIARLILHPDAPKLRDLALIGALAGAGMLAKFNIGFLLPVIGAAVGMNAWRIRDFGAFLRGTLITGGLTIMIAAWWYVRNWQLYGDPTGLNAFLDIVGRRTIPANAAQLWSERHTFLMSYWGLFGGVNVPFADWIYTIFNGIAALAALGLGIACFTHLKTWKFSPHLLIHLIMVAWIVILFAGLLRWTAETWASQGRLMFAAIAPLSVYMAFGLHRILRKSGLVVVSLWFGSMAVVGLLTIISAYRPPIPYQTSEDASPVTFSEPETPSQPALRVYPTLTTFSDVQVGEYLQFSMVFAQNSRMRRNWSAFIHLQNPQGLIVAQRDIYLGEGLFATQQLAIPSDQVWVNRFAVRVPEYANAPDTLEVYLGFYDLKTGERMLTSAASDNRLRLGKVNLLPRTHVSDLPNPMTAQLGGQVTLVGYKVEKLRLAQGDSLQLTLYWRAEVQLETDYRVFVQLVQPNSTNVYAQSDGMPAAWSRPTSTWQIGEVIEDTHTLTVSQDAPIGDWQLIVGMYRLLETTDGPKFDRLRVILPDGSQAEDFINLTRIRVAN